MDEIINSAKEIGLFSAEIIIALFFCKQYLNQYFKKSNVSKLLPHQNKLDIEILNKLEEYKEKLNADRIHVYEFHNGDRKSAFSCVNIHIPPEGRLEPAAVRDSLTAAGPYIRQIYGIDPDEFRCKTWLLSSQIRDLYRPDSNLAAFRKMFGTITDGTDCTDEVIGYLFHCPVGTALAELPAETSLQRAVKQRLLQGSRIQIGEGILREYPPL